MALTAASAAQIACAPARETNVDDLAQMYAPLPNSSAPRPDPIVFLPGLLGSELTDARDGKVLWGRFLGGTIDMHDPEYLRAVALPMTGGAALADLTDDVHASNVLTTAQVEIGRRVFSINAYPGVLTGLLVAERDDVEGVTTRRELARTARSVPQDFHETPARPVAFDWRRDLSEAARALHEKIERVVDAQLAEAEREGKIRAREDVRIDVGAHSLGSQVVRYYLRYGTTPLPDDGSLPQITWAGAKHVRRVILVAPPNNGSLHALSTLMYGDRPMMLLPKWPPALVCSYPAMFQLMPHPDLEPVLYSDDGTKVDLYDVETWERYDWGPFAPNQDRILEAIMPEVPDRRARLRKARAFVLMALNRAAQMHVALDRRVEGGPGITYHLFASDAVDTESRYWIDRASGKIVRTETTAGDGVVTRQSALADMRLVNDPRDRIDSAIPWSSVHFGDGDHLSLLGDPNLVDNLLYMIFQQPVQR